MQRVSDREFAMRLRQPGVLVDNFVKVEGGRRKRRLDDFFLYTSVSGLRFLHSRNPVWFQVMSAVALGLSLTCCVYHSWTFGARFLQPGHPAQLTTASRRQVGAPHVVVCPHRRFRMLEADYTGDFAFVLAHHWREPNREPRFANRSLDRFLQETLAAVVALERRPADRRVLDEAAALSARIGGLLPECGMLVNASNALRLLDPRFQWETHAEYAERKAQNDSCFRQRLAPSAFQSQNASIGPFFACRLSKVRSLLQRTVGNLRQLRLKLQSAPPVRGFFLECRWFDGSECKYEEVDSPYGVKCWEVSSRQPAPVTSTTAFLATRLTVDTQVFNNQADGWEKTEVRVALVEVGGLRPNLSAFFRTGGGSLLDLEINSFTDFYYEGSCEGPLSAVFAQVNADGPTGEACLWRRFNVDYSMTPIAAQPRLAAEWAAERAATWRVIDRLVQDSIGEVYAPLLTHELQRLFHDYFEGTFLLGRIVQSTHLLERNKPLPVSKACAESALIAEVRQKADALLVWIHAVEANSTDGRSTGGLADSVRDDSHPVATKFVRYYARPENVERLGDYFDRLYELLTDLRNHLRPGSECFELVASVRQFLTNTSMVGRTRHNDKQSVLESRLLALLKRRDARLIFEDYAAHNHLEIRVRFRHLYGEVIGQADEYTAFRLVADVGCTMGLYFGLSVLTLYEFLLFVFVRDAADGATDPPPRRALIYGRADGRRREGGRKLSLLELHIPPPPF